MVTTVRYLVSRHLGKAVAIVTIDEHEESMVHLTAPPPVDLSLCLTFRPERIAPLDKTSDDSADLVDIVARHAIAQAHRLYPRLRKCRIPSPIPLEPAAHPWVGDLLSTPFGGATLGIEERANGPPDHASDEDAERRGDEAVYEAVEQALDAQQAQGTNAAIAILARRGIPDHAILRLLSSPAFRRKRA